MADLASWCAYDFAVVRVVPHPFTGAFVPVGVVLHARTREFLEMRVLTDAETLGRRVPDVDPELLARYLRAIRSVCEGDPTAGPVALAPRSERFHWLTAPRSDVIQSGPVHGGVCEDPTAVIEELFATYVAADEG
ncbi:MAG: DUF3037 domain-containing protein [Gemmatimonadetes bacterium]|nr:DUF3037 domain-containing protein [Gemmatimonadota bacterium]